MEPTKNNKKNRLHLFTVDILIEESSSGKATEKLLSALNQDAIQDYKITSGMELGLQIDAVLKSGASQQPFAVPAPNPAKPKTKAAASSMLEEMIPGWIEKGTLIRLSIVKGRGIKLSLPCRIIHYDPDSENLSAYHVDEKKVYLIKLNEIDDISLG